MQTLAALKNGQLSSVSRLQLAENLSQFPEEIFGLADTLEVLDLSNNQLSSLPDNFGQLKNLKIVFLSNNQFESLPTVLADCPKLEMIGFKANKIHTVEENSLPTHTRWLILTDNYIETLPDSMGQLYRLQKLALAGNRLRSLPDSMANCRNLELVRLAANQLTYAPDWLLQLPKLAWLALGGNAFDASNTSLVKSDMLKVPMADITLAEQLGEGASGVIYKGHWNTQPASLQGTASDIAVKLFKGEVTSDGYPADELACCLQAGEHPNLIKVVSQINQQDHLGLVMELIPARFYNLGLPPSLVTCTRDTFAADTYFSDEAIIQICLQMAEAMTHLHKHGVSHGDLYAHNTMINDQADMLFGDFGAATDLSVLPILQQEAMEAIEVRAFGCLLDDLLTVSDKGVNEEADDLWLQSRKTLSYLRDLCLNTDNAMRPRFADIQENLALAQSAHTASLTA